jgi:hypothetical protein
MEPHGTTTANEKQACLLGYFVCLVAVAAPSRTAPMTCSKAGSAPLVGCDAKELRHTHPSLADMLYSGLHMSGFVPQTPRAKADWSVVRWMSIVTHSSTLLRPASYRSEYPYYADCVASFKLGGNTRTSPG